MITNEFQKQMEMECLCVLDSLLFRPICITPTVFVLLGYTIAPSSEEVFSCGQWRGPETQLLWKRN